MADDARAHLFHPNMRKLSSLLILRHDSYIQFLQAVMLIISRVHVVSKELRRAQIQVGIHPEKLLPRSIVFTTLWEDGTLCYAPFTLKFSGSMLSQHLSRQSAIVSAFATATSGLNLLELMFLVNRNV